MHRQGGASKGRAVCFLPERCCVALFACYHSELLPGTAVSLVMTETQRHNSEAQKCKTERLRQNKVRKKWKESEKVASRSATKSQAPSVLELFATLW